MAKRNLGGGRKKSVHDGGLSRQIFLCVVDGCNLQLRSDKVKEHYLNQVIWTTDGDPAPTYSDAYKKSSDVKRLHTKYFRENNFNKTSLPESKQPINVPSNPFDVCSTKKKKTNTVTDTSTATATTSTSSNSTVTDTTIAATTTTSTSSNSTLTDITAAAAATVTYSDTNVTATFATVVPSLNTNVDIENNYGNVDEDEYDVVIETDTSNIEGNTSSRLTEKDIDAIAEKVATMIIEKKVKKTDVEESDFRKLLTQLTETETEYMCMPCIKYAHCNKVPARLKKFSVGNYVFFKKLDATRLINKERRNNMKDHFSSPLHAWCQAYSNEIEKDIEDFRRKNEAAGMIVITNALYCLKHSLSSVDFVRLNDKDELLADISATKNDGAEQFFHYREVAHEKLRSYLKDVFKNVKSASLTLDKVTVGRVAYTVLVTYFFHEGRIRAILNSLHVMKSYEYDGVNTANMIGVDLMASLGLTKQQVGQIFHHSVYDGVYASPEERVKGGGCLSLNKHFAEWCDVVPESFTGNWDMGHKLQLVYGDVLLKDKNVKTLNGLIFGSMGDFTSGQASLKFKELSQELMQPTLSNKKSQDTRWARATLGAYASFFRNLPTLYILYGREALACAEVEDQDQEYYNSKVDDLSNGSSLALGIGVCQLLEQYSKASLDSQYLSSFPTTVLKSINQLQEQLMKWTDGWEWEKESMLYADIGSPMTLIKNMKDGFFEPNVSDGAKKRFLAGRKVDQKIAIELQNELSHDWENVSDMVDLSDLNDVVAVGDVVCERIPVLDFGEEEEQSVFMILQSLAKNLNDALNNRLKTIPIIQSIFNAFGDYTWYKENSFNSANQINDLKNKITDVCNKIQGPFKNAFDEPRFIDEIVNGYNIYMRFVCKYMSVEGRKFQQEEIYQQFWMTYKDLEETQLFREFFEFAQGKTYSEAICESIGSIMNMATGRGRNLHPANFNKEICLRFNLPPLHVLNGKFAHDILRHELANRKEFIRKADSDNRQLRKLTFKATSASIGNFRNREEEKFHGVLNGCK